MAHPGWVLRLFAVEDLDAIAVEVRRAEARTTAEVRVHMERAVPAGRETLGRAQEVFRRLRMHKTRQRNGVLVYLALEDRRLAIVGDSGIHARVGDTYWADVRDLMVRHLHLRAAAPREAVVRAVEELGSVLARHFPRGPGDDPNELANEVSTG
jgi:uncharacterized membrane protein